MLMGPLRLLLPLSSLVLMMGMSSHAFHRLTPPRPKSSLSHSLHTIAGGACSRNSGAGWGFPSRRINYDNWITSTTRLWSGDGEGGQENAEQLQEQEEPSDLAGKVQKYFDNEENRKDAVM